MVYLLYHIVLFNYYIFLALILDYFKNNGY
jgi:hypothetical protein